MKMRKDENAKTCFTIQTLNDVKKDLFFVDLVDGLVGW